MWSLAKAANFLLCLLSASASHCSGAWSLSSLFAGPVLGVGNNVSVQSFSWLKSMSQIVGLTATWQDRVEGNPTGANTASNAKVNITPVHTEFNFFL